MKAIRISLLLLSLFLGNIPFIMANNWVPALFLWLSAGLGVLAYLIFQLYPLSARKLTFRLRVLDGGYVLLWVGAVGLLLEGILIWIQCLTREQDAVSTYVILLSGLLTVLLLVFCAYNGVVRILITSRQLKLLGKILLATTMWIPLWNLFWVWKVCRIVRKEYIVESDLHLQNTERAVNQVCKTKYPIVMVHGIFFRDWQLMNYWGRIPKELILNGASVFYGKQESALPVEESAGEVKKNILEAIEKSGSDKVNVIAHSKGGLDTRYAISCLGMDRYVASLTTVNTPHYGCVWAEQVLTKLPDKFVRFAAKRYNQIFYKLGDKRPDFYEAVKDLTYSRCEKLNEQMPDMGSVYYQSVTSIMKSRRSAAFPLNLVYPIVRKSEGENDGLVGVDSAKWGTFLGVLKCQKKRGISHADMIDLMRENIEGFNVREYYIDLVKGLKEKGF